MTDPVETFVTFFLIGFLVLGLFIMRNDYKIWKDLKETRKGMSIGEFFDTFGTGLWIIVISGLLSGVITIL